MLPILSAHHGQHLIKLLAMDAIMFEVTLPALGVLIRLGMVEVLVEVLSKAITDALLLQLFEPVGIVPGDLAGAHEGFDPRLIS